MAADYLRQVPAAVRFISAELLFGPVDAFNLDRLHWAITGGRAVPDTGDATRHGSVMSGIAA